MTEASEYFQFANQSAHDWFLKAVSAIDKAFGEGYAEKNPQLFGAYIQTCAIDFAANHGAEKLYAGLKLIADELGK